jgi:hypothetical protein
MVRQQPVTVGPDPKGLSRERGPTAGRQLLL